MSDAAVPGRARGLLALCRVSNLPTVWMNVVAAAALSGPGVAPGALALLAFALSAFYCAGMALNDLCDREIDAREQPFRPLPSGRVTLGEARTVTLALFGTGLAGLALAPHASALVPGLALVGLIAAYDVLHKRHPWTLLLMGGCRAMVFVVVGQAVAGAVAPRVLAAGFLQLAYTLLVTAVARYENTRGERFRAPVIPRMIAGMSLIDGGVLAFVLSPIWLLPGLAAAGLTQLGQRFVRGD